MYLEHFRLSQNPFQINSDPSFLWYGEKHKEALATLQYGLHENKGFLLLTGDIGLGKTTIINSLLQLIGDKDLSVLVDDPRLEILDFFNLIADSFGMAKAYSAKGVFLRDFKSFLLKSQVEERKVLLIIDEAQRLTQELLEELRIFSNFEKNGAKLLKIFFVGQMEFNQMLLRPENKAVRQRIAVNYNIEPLTESETEEYIHFRLAVAGGDKTIFDKGAVKAIYGFSKGYPRLINVIADRSMLTAFIESKKYIDRKVVLECANELDISRATIPKGSHTAREGQKSGYQKIEEAFQSVDSKMFRKALDDIGIARTSLLRMAMTRIYRAIGDPKELKKTLQEEASRISQSSCKNELKMILKKNNLSFLAPIISLLHRSVFDHPGEKITGNDHKRMRKAELDR